MSRYRKSMGEIMAEVEKIGQELPEVSPPGWKGTVKALKKKKFNKRGDVPFREFAETLFDSKRCKDIRSSTHRRYVIGLEKNVFPLIKSKSLRAIHGRDFEAVKEKMSAEGRDVEVETT